MHKSIYDISIEYATLVQELIDSEGELTPELEYALQINKEELNKKAEAYALRILEFEGQAELVKAEAARLQARAQQLQKTADKLADIISSAMKQFDVEKIKTERVTLSFRKSEKAVLAEGFADSVLKYCKVSAEIDEEKIQAAKEEAEAAGAEPPVFPDDEMLEYFNVKAEAIVSKIKEALKEGKAVGDCMLLKSKNLQIK
jgi:hypothetical protein